MSVALSTDLLDRVCRLAAVLPPSLSMQLAAAIRAADTAAESDNICNRLLPHLLSDNRGLFLDFIQAWWQTPEAISGASIAASLEAAAHQAARLRNLSGVELVWTGPSGMNAGMRSTEQVILDMIRSARHSIYVVTFAAYRVSTLVGALTEAVDRGVRVSFILEDKDESEGKVTENALPALSGDGLSTAKVYVWPLDQRPRNERGQHGALHAKCVLVDGQRLFVSSANMTEFALTLNIELGVLLNGGDAPRQVERNLTELIRTGVLKPQTASR
jgi:phosphatidylserine/phosphatidylglycerophosphate/cardiolipin synthase-like enzyme